jgi:hypothetical protein
MTPISVASRCFMEYKYSSRPTLLLIQHVSSFSSRVYSLPLHLCAMEEKRCIKRSRSTSGSSSSSSGASTPLPSPSESVPPPVSPPEASPRKLPSPVCEHDGPFEAIPVVDLSFDEEEIFPDITWGEEFA